ncbi:hypothetical protein PSACC_02059 [Paramicrosporidium saccamoebae]|uniref:Uncharacterized protein n=1 Tax=Paramicrosporidium saccamoebae TaxID=1246581 RepID=A0A2H9TK75_9FUNG|nr:hypothetical protein PSACC_02059 [Paramicrosporidium saccamoebae]
MLLAVIAVTLPCLALAFRLGDLSNPPDGWPYSHEYHDGIDTLRLEAPEDCTGTNPHSNSGGGMIELITRLGSLAVTTRNCKAMIVEGNQVVATVGPTTNGIETHNYTSDQRVVFSLDTLESTESELSESCETYLGATGKPTRPVFEISILPPPDSVFVPLMQKHYLAPFGNANWSETLLTVPARVDSPHPELPEVQVRIREDRKADFDRRNGAVILHIRRGHIVNLAELALSSADKWADAYVQEEDGSHTLTQASLKQNDVLLLLTVHKLPAKCTLSQIVDEVRELQSPAEFEEMAKRVFVDVCDNYLGGMAVLVEDNDR